MRPRTLGEILAAAFDIYKVNALKLLLVVGAIAVPLSFIGAVLAQVIDPEDVTTTDAFGNVTIDSGGFFAAFAGGIILLVVGVIIWGVIEAATVRAAAEATIGDPVDVEASYRWGLKRFGSVLLVALLVGLAVFAGAFVFLIGALIVGTFLFVSIPALVVENRRGTEAMKRSWHLVSGNFWHALGVIVVMFIITGVISGIIRAIGGSNWFVAWIFDAIAQIITAPFAALVSVLLYLDLRARTEALTADSLRSELASNA
jgi:hypothetical protein